MIELYAVSALKGLAEALLMIYMAKGVLWAVAGAKRDSNVVFVLFKKATGPFDRLAKRLAPSFVSESHVGFIPPGVAFSLWVCSLVWKLDACQRIGMAFCIQGG